MAISFRLFLATAMAASSLIAQAKLTGQQLTMRCDPPAGSLSRLSQAQKETFAKSQDMFIAHRYDDAVGELRGLLAQLPPNTPAHTALAERTAEAALEAKDRAYSISLLKPIEEGDGNDCSAITLLARAYAEDGSTAERDDEISALTSLHSKARNSPAGRLDAFLLERYIPKGGGVLEIWYVLRCV